MLRQAALQQLHPLPGRGPARQYSGEDIKIIFPKSAIGPRFRLAEGFIFSLAFVCSAAWMIYIINTLY